MKKKILITIIGGVAIFVGAARVQARISYGSGSYTNLCGGGTNAESYTCSSGCNPAQGRCQSDNESVVKWTCNGKLNQCGENESAWANVQELGQPGCDKTVQLSLFDKNCRKNDGSWDTSCVLSGYMVWYSGTCNGLSPTVGYSATPSATATISGRPAATPTVRPTGQPTVKPTIKPTTNSTPGNSTESGETKGGVTTTPETGPENLINWVIAGLLAGGGWWLVKMSKKVL